MPRAAGHLLGYVAVALGLQKPASCEIYISLYPGVVKDVLHCAS